MVRLEELFDSGDQSGREARIFKIGLSLTDSANPEELFVPNIYLFFL
jgi:hypothetical protein